MSEKATNLIPVSLYPCLRLWMQSTVAEEQIGVQSFVPVMCLVPGRDNTCRGQQLLMHTGNFVDYIQEWASNGHECICKADVHGVLCGQALN